MSTHIAKPVLRDWHEYVAMSEDELARQDIAAVNLACAAGLPGAEQIDAAGCWAWLARATDRVRRWTDAGRTEFFLQHPEEYNHSEAYFRVLALTTVLQRHCGLTYNPAARTSRPAGQFELHEQFIHGAIQGPGGTCSSIPVLYASIGRRLGYPIKLVNTRQHLFARWDDPMMGERFNIECAGQGFADPPDDYYRGWPVPIRSAEEERAFGFLESFTPRRELAAFVAERAFSLCSHHRYREGIETFAVAAQLVPRCALYPDCILRGLAEWKKHLQSRSPPQFPRRIVVDMRPSEARWPWMPWGVEREFACLHATEECLTDPRHEEWWWRPLRENRPPLREVPTGITVDYDRMFRSR